MACNSSESTSFHRLLDLAMMKLFEENEGDMNHHHLSDTEIPDSSDENEDDCEEEM